MINFFRKIRKQLADDNQFFKYARYAIGEILLVVIGILIALQINNWNENKKLKEYELKMLKEIYTTAKDDIEFQELQIGANISTVSSAQIIFKSINDSLPYSDSLKYHFSNFLRRFKSFFADNAYQNAKQYGLDFIYNDSLKQELIWTYERNASYLEELNERDNLYEYNVAVPILTELLDMVDFSEDISQYNSILSVSLLDFSNEFSSENTVPIDYEALKENIKFKNIVKTTISRRKKLIMFQKIRLMRMNRLVKLLELEIATR